MTRKTFIQQALFGTLLAFGLSACVPPIMPLMPLLAIPQPKKTEFNYTPPKFDFGKDLKLDFSAMMACSKSESEQPIAEGSEVIVTRMNLVTQTQNVRTLDCDGRPTAVAVEVLSFGREVVRLGAPVSLAGKVVSRVDIANAASCDSGSALALSPEEAQPIDLTSQGSATSKVRIGPVVTTDGRVEFVVESGALKITPDLIVNKGMNVITLKYFGKCDGSQDEKCETLLAVRVLKLFASSSVTLLPGTSERKSCPKPN